MAEYPSAPRMQTVRFSQVVAACGKPGVYLTLTTPEKDKALMRLVTKTRVMTLHQMLRGGKKDYGTVGLHLTPGAQVLVFQKSLRRYADKRVVGINYDLLTGPPLGEARTETAPPPGAAPAPARETPREESEIAEEAPPPTLREILREIKRARRLLGARKLVATRELLSRLGRRIAEAID